MHYGNVNKRSICSACYYAKSEVGLRRLWSNSLKGVLERVFAFSFLLKNVPEPQQISLKTPET